MLRYHPEGFDLRFPGSRAITRTPHVAAGSNHQIGMDGHEKLSPLALKMGGVGFGIYGGRDKFSSTVVHLQAVPSCRLAGTVGHMYLDMIENLGGKCYMSRQHNLYLVQH